MLAIKTVSLMTLAAISAFSLTLSVSTTEAHAGRPSDFFSTNGSGQASVPTKKKFVEVEDPRIGQQGALAMASRQSPQLHWFEAFDELVVTLRPTEQDKAILTKPFNKELERVQQYIKVAAKVSSNYKLLAKKIRSMPVPPVSPGLKEYQMMKADFYEDMASVYDELIVPRRPAQTQEELAEQLDEVKQRSDQLKVQGTSLMASDMDLRRTFNVHTNKHDNPLWQYVTGGR